jgi:hypothetical protein
MADVTRYKYRPAPVHPTGHTVSPNSYISLKKKVPVPPEPLPEDDDDFVYQDPYMVPSLTQKQNVAYTVKSPEKELRLKEAPSFEHRLSEHANHLKRKQNAIEFKEAVANNQKRMDNLLKDAVWF